MPLHTYLEFSCDHIGWKDVLQLLQASRDGGGMLDVYKRGFCFYISPPVLQPEVSRHAWISEARELGLSDVFIDIAVQAAEKGARVICAGLYAEMDPELPTQAPQEPNGNAGINGSAAPHRFLVCKETQHIFHDRYGAEHVRWIADWAKLTVIKVQVYDRDAGKWEDAAHHEHDDVVESIEQNGFLADPEEWGLLACDELPEWGR